MSIDLASLLQLPNPVEPNAAPDNHPLNKAPRRERKPNHEFLHLLREPNTTGHAEPPTKRRRSGDNNLLNLPRLPVRDGARKLRIPPTLSGLHQPPPNAGLLPSISVDQPKDVQGGHERCETLTEGLVVIPSERVENEDRPSSSAEKPSSSKPKRKKWSDEETACLLKGVARFGIGKWTTILNCPDYHFERRTALDLKDRFRVCCPDDYKTVRKSKRNKSSEAQGKKQNSKAPTSKCSRLSPRELSKLGIDAPFAQSSRRKRRGYTAEEDDAIRRGFEKYGNSWARILQDDDFTVLKDRTPTDLRDRLRTRFPDKYKGAGLAPRPEIFPKRPDRSAPKTDIEQEKPEPRSPRKREKSVAAQLIEKAATTRLELNANEQPASVSRKQPIASLLSSDDVFWGAPLDEDMQDSAPVTLDRRILDWAYEGTGRSGGQSDITRHGVDPPSTLNLPPPTAAANSQAISMQNMSNAAALPSLATITASTFNGDDAGDQLELPSLISGFGALEGDGRPGGQFLSLYDILS